MFNAIGFGSLNDIPVLSRPPLIIKRIRTHKKQVLDAVKRCFQGRRVVKVSHAKDEAAGFKVRAVAFARGCGSQKRKGDGGGELREDLAS